MDATAFFPYGRSPLALTTPVTTSKPSQAVVGVWVAVAMLLRPQGRRGELLAEPLSDLAEIFTVGREVAVTAPGSTPAGDIPVRSLEGHWLPAGKNAGRMVLKLSGCDSINDAELLAGHQVWVTAAALPALDADTFFVGDLLGCAFFDGDLRAGTIVDVEFPTGPDGRTRLQDAAPLFTVELNSGGERVLVPFVRAWLQNVDVAAKRVVMRLPEGLLGGAEVIGSEEGGSEDNGDDDAV